MKRLLFLSLFCLSCFGGNITWYAPQYYTSGPDDPTVVATAGIKGNLYFKNDGKVYVKLDQYPSTNWSQINAASSGGITSINSDTTAAQLIVGTSPVSASTSGGTTTVALGNIPVTKLNSGTGASSSTFWRGDGTWAAASGSVAIGGAVGSGTANSAWYIDGSGNIGQDAGYTYTAATHSLAIPKYLGLGGATGSSTFPLNIFEAGGGDASVYGTDPNGHYSWSARNDLSVSGNKNGFSFYVSGSTWSGAGTGIYAVNQGIIDTDVELVNGMGFVSGAGPIQFAAGAASPFALKIDASNNVTLGATGSSGGTTINGGAITINGTVNAQVNSSSSKQWTWQNSGSGLARMSVQSGGGNAVQTYTLQGTGDWGLGYYAGDNSFRLSPNNDIGTGDVLTVTTGGAFTFGAASSTPQHALNTSTGTTGADVLTLTNGVTGTAGNPTGYIKITVNGSANHYIPYW